MQSRRVVLLLIFGLACASGCAGSGNAPLPGGLGANSAALLRAAKASPTPTPKPTPRRLPPSVINAGLEGAEAYYAGLPHKDPVTDLQSLASHLLATKVLTSAVVADGSISATFPDGSRAILIRPRGLGVATGPAGSPPPIAPVGPATQHEIAFLVNEHDALAFAPSRQTAFAKAFVKLQFPQAGYGVDVQDVTLDNIVALGNGHPLDFLDLATHGAVAVPGPYYLNASNTPITDANLAKYAADLAKGTVQYAVVLAVTNRAGDTPALAFTPTFLTDHLRFNPGAIFDNESCFGQSPLIANAVHAALQGAGVGRYIGWTKFTSGDDADQSDAFLLDRLLGEQKPSVTGLDAYASQRAPAQRPFSLDAVESVMPTEIRSGPLDCDTKAAYTVGICGDAPDNAKYPPLADGEATRMIFTDLGGEKVADPPIFYALPSIEYMTTTEYSNPYSAPKDPTALLSIDGYFPKTPGKVTIENTAGTFEAPVRSWAPCTACLVPGMTQVQVAIPNEGAGSSGRVTVYSAPEAGGSRGIASNAVPLTQWPGTISERDDENITLFDQMPGKGSGHVYATMNFRIRADVHPTVATIDTAPAPQNFSYSAIQNDAVGKIDSVSGSFTSTNGQIELEFSPGSTTSYTPLRDLFSLSPVAWTAKPGTKNACNTSIAPGPQPGAGNVLCTLFGLQVFSGLACTDNANGTWCQGGNSIWYAFGYGTGTPETSPPGIVLTLDP
jgi:hypothetical protein